jgi:hypothetical protein
VNHITETQPIDPEKKSESQGDTLRLLDGASSHSPIIAPELKTQRQIAADKNLPLNDRLEAYEDIIDSEVGDTTLSRVRNIERDVGLRQIYLKFEGGNPTGTQKDRIAFAQAMDALRRGFDASPLPPVAIMASPWLSQLPCPASKAISMSPKVITQNGLRRCESSVLELFAHRGIMRAL